MSRSSIFSSDTLACQISLAPGAAWCAVFCVIVRLSIAGLTEQLEQIPSVRLDTGWAHSLRQLDDLENKAPKVLFVGTSRTDSSIVTTSCLRNLGLRNKDVLKVTRGGLTFWDASILFRRYPECLESVKVVYIDLMRFQFRQQPESMNHFYLYASLQERLSLPWPQKIEAVVDWFWPAASERRTLREWVLGIVDLAAARSSRSVTTAEDQSRYWTGHERQQQMENQAQISEKRRRNAKNWARGFSDWSPNTNSIADFEQLLSMLTKKGILVILHEPPLHGDVYSTIEQDPDLNAGWRKYREVINNHLSEEVLLFRVKTMGELGLDDSELLDYGHLGRHAAELYTDQMTRRLTAMGVAF